MNFRFENNLPTIYVQESRDFQLLCHIADVLIDGCINKVATMQYQSDLDNCDENLLWAIANKQGFTTQMYFPPDVLRNVCRVFPFCISRKGTKEAIEVASLAVLSVDRLLTNINISVKTVDSAGSDENSFVVYIESTSPGVYSSPYLKYLKEVLSFLVPCGWGVSYSILKSTLINSNTSIQNIPSVAVLSTITSNISNSTPLKFTVAENKVIGSPEKFNKTYSKIGVVKIISSKSSKDIQSEKHLKVAPLVNTDDGTIFIYGSNVNATE